MRPRHHGHNTSRRYGISVSNTIPLEFLLNGLACDAVGFALIVLEVDVPVSAVAEGLVLGTATTAKCVVLSRCALAPRDIVQLNATADVVGSVFRDVYFWFTLLVAMFYAVDGITEGARGTLPDRLRDGLDIGPVRVNPRFRVHPPHGRTT